MKKITIAAMLLAAAIAFTSCGNPAGSGAGNQNNTGSGDAGSGDAGSGDSNTTTVTFDDCTTSITRDQIVLSDGNWEIKQEEEGPTSLETTVYVASSSSNVLTFTSGTFKRVVDFADQWSNFNNGTGAVDLNTLSDEEQLEVFNYLFNNSTNTISGTVVTSTRDFTSEELEYRSNNFTFNSIQEDAEIKINSAETKCKIVWTIPSINFTIRIFAHKL